MSRHVQNKQQPFISALFALFWVLCAVTLCFPAHASKSRLLMDASSGKILYAYNIDQRIAPASLTKIMSMYLAQDAIKAKKAGLWDSVKISRKAADEKGSKMGLKAGEKVPLHRLLLGMAVSSGNDASMAVAEYLGGSSKAFVDSMNRKAKQLGMTGTTFKTPNGLPAKGQLTTARDMGKLAFSYIRAYPSSLERYHKIKAIKHHNDVTSNKNPLLGKFKGADGLKTGWVAASGYNLIGTAKRGKTRLIAVVLGAASVEERGKDCTDLLEAGFLAKQKAISVTAAMKQVAQKKSTGKKAAATKNKNPKSRATPSQNTQKQVKTRASSEKNSSSAAGAAKQKKTTAAATKTTSSPKVTSAKDTGKTGKAASTQKTTSQNTSTVQKKKTPTQKTNTAKTAAKGETGSPGKSNSAITDPSSTDNVR